MVFARLQMPQLFKTVENTVDEEPDLLNTAFIKDDDYVRNPSLVSWEFESPEADRIFWSDD